MRIKQSLCFPMMVKEVPDYDKLFGAAAEIGFAGVELWGRNDDFPQIVQAAAGHKLVVCSMVGHTSKHGGLNLPSAHDRIEQELRESIDIAADCGMPGLICLSGNRNAGQSDEQGADATAECLNRVAPHAEKKGVNLNIELLNSKVDHPGYQADHTAWGLAVCRKVNSPRVKLLYDIYHMQIMEGDIIRTIRDNIQWIGHFHAAGVPGRGDPDASQELNYAAICKAIAQTSYGLYFGLEYKPAGEMINSIRRTFAVCDQCG
ncbi:MAG: TIM barrel protein [Phycisphaerae bacterium]|jgi:hydroxypyruvate isomerase